LTDDDCDGFERRGQHMRSQFLQLMYKIVRKFKFGEGLQGGEDLKKEEVTVFVRDRVSMGQIRYLVRYLYRDCPISKVLALSLEAVSD